MADLTSTRIFGNLTISQEVNAKGDVNVDGSLLLQGNAVATEDYADTQASNAESNAKTYADNTFLGKTEKAVDAEELDGLNSSQFLRSDTNDSVSGTVSFTKDGEAAKLAGSDINSNVHMTIGGSPEYHWRLGYDGESSRKNGNYVYLTSNYKTGIRLRHTGAFEYLDTAGSAKTVWHGGNFNPSSKLDTTAKAADSDKLDGKHASEFAGSGHNHDSRYYTQSEVDTAISQAQAQAVPSGLISMWSGGSSNIPAGWALCNGNNGTPDLRDRFIVGAGGAYSDGETGGSKDAVVVSHNHSGSTTTDGYHSHSGSTTTNGNHRHDIEINNISGGSDTASGSSGTNASYMASTDYAGSHNHSLSINSNGNHNHSLNISSTGESGTDKNLPPYYALAFIMKL